MQEVAEILLGAGLTIVTCVAIGRLVLRSLEVELYRFEEEVLSFAIGAACLSLVVYLLAAIGCVRKEVFIAAAALSIGAVLSRSDYRRLAKPWPAPLEVDNFLKILFGGIFAAFTFLYFINAMAPETSPDGTWYHLGLVSRYVRDHGFSHITSTMMAALPEGIEMLFVFAFSIGRHSAAALVHFAFLIALSMALLSFGRRFGLPAAGMIASLFIFCSPVMGKDATSAYVDAGAACTVFCVFYLLQIWDVERKPALLIPIGLLAGFAYAVKYTVATAVPLVLVFIGWKLYRAKQPLARALAIVTGCAALMILPWMVKNWIIFWNPVAPLFNAFFPNPYVPVSLEQDFRDLTSHVAGLNHWWQIVWEVTVRGGILGGVVGPLFLLAPVALLGIREKMVRQTLLAAAVFGAAYAGNIYTRFLIPPLPFVALAMAIVLVRWKYIAALLVVAHGAASWPTGMNYYIVPYTWRVDSIPAMAAFRIESEEHYLSRVWASGYGIATMVEAIVPPGEKVLSFSQAPVAYTSREILLFWESGYSKRMADILWSGGERVIQPNWLLKFKFPPQPLRAIRILQHAKSKDLWSIGELKAYRDGVELSRSAWRADAHPFPWDAQLAIDDNPATRWRSWQRQDDGMFFQTDFGQVNTIDSVVLECSHDQWYVKLELQGQTAAGEWRRLGADPEKMERVPLNRMRLRAAQSIKQRGIDFVLASTGTPWGDDFAAKTADWGFTLVGRNGSDMLYRIE